MGETDFHMALYLCREIIRHLEMLNDEREGGAPVKSAIVQDLERHLCMNLEQVIAALKDLETSIEAQDAGSMLGFGDLIDNLVDYLDHLIDVAERSEPTGLRNVQLKRLKAWRGSSGKLAQLLCQID